MIFRIGFISIFLLLAGCMPSQMVSETTRYLADAGLIDHAILNKKAIPNTRLMPRSKLFVASGYGGIRDARLNEILLNLTARSLRERFPAVDVEHESLTEMAAISQARSLNAQYLCWVELLYSRDQAGHWDEWEILPEDLLNTGRDAVYVRYRLYAVDSGRLVGNYLIKVHSGLATFFNDKPEHLFGIASEELVQRISW